MLCENCGKNEANVKYTQIINGVKKEMILCEECSKKLGIGMNHLDFNMPINLSSFFGEFIEENEPTFLSQMIPQNQLTCEQCGMTYDDFVKNGKFGCSNCYDVFSNKIDPLLKNLHGANRHIGRGIKGAKTKQKPEDKIKNEPKETQQEETQKNKLEELKNNLKQAIQEEKYEEAAKLRDEIKKLEK